MVKWLSRVVKWLSRVVKWLFQSCQVTSLDILLLMSDAGFVTGYQSQVVS